MRSRTEDPFYSTNPNIAMYGDDGVYFFQEQTILQLLLNLIITRESFQRLHLLVNTSIPDEKAIFKSIWSPIAELDYDSYLARAHEFKTSIEMAIERIEHAGSENTISYTTENNDVVFISQADHARMEPSLTQYIKDKRNNHLDQSGLLRLYQEKSAEKDHAWYAGSPITDPDYHEAPDSSRSFSTQQMDRFMTVKKIIHEELPKLRLTIIKMRFLREFNHPDKRLRFEKILAEKLFSTEVRLYGKKLLANPLCPFEPAAIQKELDKQLGKETNIEHIRDLIQKGADVNALCYTGSFSILCSAIYDKVYERALLLLELGANVDLSFKSWGTAIHIAIDSRAPLHIIQALLSQTKNIDVKNAYGRTPLCMALEKKWALNGVLAHNPSLSMPCNDSGDTPLIVAAKYRRHEAVQAILSKAPETINAINKKGESALLAAFTYSGDSQPVLLIMNTLIQAGADYHLKDHAQQDVFSHAKKLRDPIYHTQLLAFIADKERGDPLNAHQALSIFVPVDQPLGDKEDLNHLNPSGKI